MTTKLNLNMRRGVVGILGNGEIGSAIARICNEADFKVLIRELTYDQLKGKKVDYLHVNISEKDNREFIEVVVKNIKELMPKLTIINSSTTPGTTKEIYNKTKSLIVHSPVIGNHPHLYESIKKYFPKIIGPVNTESLKEAKRHFQDLGLEIEVYDNSDTSEAAKLLDLVYYAWNIMFCKDIYEICEKLGLNFDQVYTKHNQIYNNGYRKILPNVTRPVLIPRKGAIAGSCTIADTLLFHKLHKNKITKFILDENRRHSGEIDDQEQERNGFLKMRERLLKRTL